MDGRKPPWMIPLALFVLVGGLLSLAICIALLFALRKQSATTLTLVRLAGVYPVAFGLQALSAAIGRFAEGLVHEGLAACILAALLFWPGVLLLLTKGNQPSIGDITSSGTEA